MVDSNRLPAGRALRLLLVLAGAVFPGAAHAAGAGCLPQVRDGWLRLPPVSMPMLVGFGRIENGCGVPVSIVAASSPAFAGVSLHQTRIVDGVSRMRAVPALEIAPGTAAVMRPGGLHLMLAQPQAALAAGGRVTVEFALSDGRRLRGEFEVRSADAR